jgi:lipoprotein-anchoring transpeptidase ErfK/SrfK
MQAPAPIEENDTYETLAPDLQRQVVNYATTVAAGTIIIDTAQTYLYYVLSNGRAIRYGIGVGRDGFTWSGAQAVTRMAEWPDWTPPQEMLERQPYLPRWMAGGKGNPLGARAIYLGSTVYRIHGTNAPATIGTKVSSGCIRMINADVIDLYSRVTVGTKIIVLPNHSDARTAAPVRLVAPRAADLRATGIY